jgi:hypothetical protein
LAEQTWKRNSRFRLMRNIYPTVVMHSQSIRHIMWPYQNELAEQRIRPLLPITLGN